MCLFQDVCLWVGADFQVIDPLREVLEELVELETKRGKQLTDGRADRQMGGCRQYLYGCSGVWFWRWCGIDMVVIHHRVWGAGICLLSHRQAEIWRKNLIRGSNTH